MNLSDIEKRITNRVKKQHWLFDPNKDLRSLTEEVGELAREIRRFEDGRERPDEKEVDVDKIKENIKVEIGDILFPLVKIAHHYNISIEEAFSKHESKMKDRYDN